MGNLNDQPNASGYSAFKYALLANVFMKKTYDANHSKGTKFEQFFDDTELENGFEKSMSAFFKARNKISKEKGYMNISNWLVTCLKSCPREKLWYPVNLFSIWLSKMHQNPMAEQYPKYFWPSKPTL